MEPTSVLAIIGFAIGQISTILFTLPQVYEVYKKYKDCEDCLNDYMLSLEASRSQYEKWEMIWRRIDPAAYRTIWGEQYDRILGARKRIHDLSQRIEERIEKIIRDQKVPPVDRQNFKRAIEDMSKKELKTWRKFVFALYTDKAIKKCIEDLKTAIDNITVLCQNEFSRKIGTNRPLTLTSEDTKRLVQFLAFFDPFTQRVKTLYEARGNGQISRRTQRWRLELGNHDETKNIGEWEHWDPVVVRFAFNVFSTGRDMSLCVEHDRDLHDGPIPAGFPSIDWERVICDQGIPIQGVSKEQWPTSQPCRSFGRLFRDGVFEREATLRSWVPRRAELILSLTSWVFLLWDTPWTAGLCSLGLRSMCGGPRQTMNDDLAVRLNILEVDFRHRTDCNHSHDNKLVGFGILLAELLTTTPIRQAPRPNVIAPIRYQKWSREIDDWEQISVRKLVNMVREKSGSADMRDVVNYCIDEASIRTPSFEPGYILEYISKIYKPIEKWCKDAISAHEDLSVEDLSVENWTSAALENPGPAQNIPPLQTNVEGHATHGIVVSS